MCLTLIPQQSEKKRFQRETVGTRPVPVLLKEIRLVTNKKRICFVFFSLIIEMCRKLHFERLTYTIYTYQVRLSGL